MSRDNFEKRGQRLGEEEVMPRVIALLHGLDDTRAQVIRLDPDTLVMYTRAIKATAEPAMGQRRRAPRSRVRLSRP
jgi:hypothetical protein